MQRAETNTFASSPQYSLRQPRALPLTPKSSHGSRTSRVKMGMEVLATLLTVLTSRESVDPCLVPSQIQSPVFCGHLAQEPSVLGLVARSFRAPPDALAQFAAPDRRPRPQTRTADPDRILHHGLSSVRGRAASGREWRRLHAILLASAPADRHEARLDGRHRSASSAVVALHKVEAVLLLQACLR